MNLNKKAKTVITAVAIVTVASGGLVYFRNNNVKSVSAEAIELPVQTETVKKTDINERISATGTVNPAEENGIYIATTQKVSEVHVELGDVVKSGDRLVDYDIDYSKKSLENNLQQQQISLKSSQLTLQSMTSELSESEVLSYESNINTAEKSILDAQNNLDSAKTKIDQLRTDLVNAEKTMNNNLSLLQAGAITQDEYDNSVTAVDNAKTALLEAENNISSYELALKNAQTSLEQAKTNYKLAQNPLSTTDAQLNYQKQQNEISKAQLTIQNVQDQISDLTESSYAHVDGTVIQVNVEEGSIVTEDSVIMKIADLDQLIVNANISEYDAPLVQVGQSVTITTDAIENTVYEGTVSYISPIATVTSTFSGSETTVAIEVEIHNPDGILKPGYSVDMEISVIDVKDVLAVSLSSVLKDARTGENYVFTVGSDGNLVKTAVEIGATDDLTIEILSGLNEGDVVISSPTSEMEEGTPYESYKTNTVIPSNMNNAGGSDSSMGFGGMGNMSGGGAPSGGSAPSGGMGGGGRP